MAGARVTLDVPAAHRAHLAPVLEGARKAALEPPVSAERRAEADALARLLRALDGDRPVTVDPTLLYALRDLARASAVSLDALEGVIDQLHEAIVGGHLEARVLHAVPAADGLAGEAAVVEQDWSTEPVGSRPAVTLRVTAPSGVRAAVPLGREAARLLACGLIEEAG